MNCIENLLNSLEPEMFYALFRLEEIEFPRDGMMESFHTNIPKMESNENMIISAMTVF